jgi:hypothetical protein
VGACRIERLSRRTKHERGIAPCRFHFVRRFGSYVKGDELQNRGWGVVGAGVKLIC